ncbi:hypothetical protein AKJ09_11089 [Labilithrix luteola]|uniref:Uncharacterized protein n=2 Tax=Labilithrix luteola TaxID=1391654 RepID=A0A0K1QF75_9BACT|nr:hypothetical protein AKJ09_11089 [Labilithrix luteola]
MSAVANGMTQVQMRGAAPIPVGHRVEVRVFYGRSNEGLFGGGDPVPVFDRPLITDLDTGVRYGQFEHFHPPISGYGPGLLPLSHSPMTDLREHSRWYGKIVVCNVVFTGFREKEIQTTFLIEPSAPPSPGYR